MSGIPSENAEHGTAECWDAGCRRVECVRAADERRDAAFTARVQAIVEPLLPVVGPEPTPEDDPPPGDEPVPGDEDPSSGE